MKIKVEFSGGLELLFDGQKSIQLDDNNLDGKSMKDFILYVKDNLLKERPELFVQGETVRPGILVLVNDTDWELVETVEYKLTEGDTIVFISTLHGG